MPSLSLSGLYQMKHGRTKTTVWCDPLPHSMQGTVLWLLTGAPRKTIGYIIYKDLQLWAG